MLSNEVDDYYVGGWNPPFEPDIYLAKFNVIGYVRLILIGNFKNSRSLSVYYKGGGMKGGAPVFSCFSFRNERKAIADPMATMVAPIMAIDSAFSALISI
ncbi:hypothetical protein [Paenibacillus sp. L3-i20]|uniref:hypothetical protein n=1 Tax=Paenibacillus sp. L3-i20 TaxID=2905833 RepID=UPI00207F0215|nr:hypothetical protein [Paenibacillus sp. L3-i20]GKU78404.1 hypothetical protein L3i20_v228010 [Paenibacillus sp. L3-i20]